MIVDESEGLIAAEQYELEQFAEEFNKEQNYPERAAAAVEWVEKHAIIPQRFTRVLTGLPYWIVRLNGNRLEGPTFLAIVEAAMKETP